MVSAESVPDDFEWKVLKPVAQDDHNQYLEGVYKDIKSETVYAVFKNYDPITGDPILDEHVVVNRFNTTTHEFDLSFSKNYSRPASRYIVYGGTWYVFHVSEGLLHMRIDNSTYDTMKWVYDYNGLRWLGVHDGVLFFLMGTGVYSQTIDLHSVNLTTLAWSRKEIIRFEYQGPYYGHETNHIFKNGTLFLTRSPGMNLQNYKAIWLYEYDTDSGLSVPARRIWTTNDTSFGRWDFDIDSEGNIHLLLERQVWRLVKLTPSGGIIEWVDLEVEPGDNGTTRGDLVIMVDGSDVINVIGWLYYNTTENGLMISWTMTLDYSSKITRNTIYRGRIRMNANEEMGMMCFSEGEVIAFLHIIIEDKYLLSYTCKIPPSPDLSMSPGEFKFSEQRGSDRPVTVSFKTTNIGKADAERYNISFFVRPIDGSEYELVDSIDCNETLAVRSGRTHERAMSLPRGGMMLRILIHEVVPFENYVQNNVIEVMIFVTANSPPTLTVVRPENGTLVDDTITIEGRTIDPNTDDEVINIIDGLPDLSIHVPARGTWNYTVDLDDIPSGDYVLAIRAFDGSDHSSTVLRLVRVDHPEETLLMSSFRPESDVSLLVGEVAEFTVAVREHFSRSVEYSWFIDGDKRGLSTPIYLYQSQVPGMFILRVEATNDRSIVIHEWNLSVREPIVPTIISRSPDEKVIRVGLAQPVGFSFNISNPDGLDISIVWRRGEVELPQRDIMNYTLSFESKGRWTVSAIIHSTRTAWIESWIVIVDNTPPRIVSMDPGPPIAITEGDTVTFTVEAFDPDGDILSYDWTALNYTVSSVNSSALQIKFKEIEKREIILILEVSDGADHNSTRWTIVIEKSSETDDDDFNLTLSISIVVAAVLISSFVFFYNRKSTLKQ